MRRMGICLLLLMMLLSCACAEEAALLFAVNVGKADAMLLKQDDTLYLIDTGKAESWGQLSCALTKLGVTRLSGVIVTHTDKDHVGGLMALATSSIEVDAWYASRYYADVKADKHPAVLAAAVRGQTVQWLSSGDVLPLGSGTLRVLAPMEASEDENDNSLVLLAEGTHGRMLLMGDAEYAEESQLLDTHTLPVCEVLKVGHHGGDDATSELLVRTVRPQLAVISTSTAERRETPAEAVLQRLYQAGTTVVQTQNASGGVLVRLENGHAEAALVEWTDLPSETPDVRITDKQAKADVIRLTNQGRQTADLSHWFIRSGKGNELFVLPMGTLLAPGETIAIGTLSTDEAVDLVWPDKNVWHNKQTDEAFLYDSFGRLMDAMQ